MSDSGVDGQLEHLFYTFHLFAAAFNVSSTHLSSNSLALFGCDGRQTLGLEEVDANAVGPQVRLEANENEWGGGAEMEDFRVPLRAMSDLPYRDQKKLDPRWMTYLVHDILKGVGAVDSEADENEVGLRVRKRTKTIVFFLARGVPEGELNSFAAWLMGGVCHVVLEDGRYVFLNDSLGRLQGYPHQRSYLWKVTLAIADQETSLAATAIADYDEFF